MTTETEEIWTIRKLVVESFKRIIAVEITPDGKVVQLRGKNEAGKSSIIDAIWAALGGLDAAPGEPVRKGAKGASIQMHLGPEDDPTKGVIVTRTFDPRGSRYSTLTVAAANGAVFRSPQHMLEEFYAALTLDPLAFSRLKPAERIAELAKVSGIDMSVIAGLEARIRGFRADRTILNRDAKIARGKAAGIQFPEGLPTRLIDESLLSAELAAIGERNVDRERKRAARERTAGEISGLSASARRKNEQSEEYRRKADELAEDAREDAAKATTLQQQLDAAPPLPAVVDNTDILARMAAARDTNRYIQERQRRQETEAEAVLAENKSQELTAAIDKTLAEIKGIVAGGMMPVESLEIGEDDVLLGGIPFDQLSAAQKIKTSAAIAMAAKPRIRILCVRDGALLDDDNFEVLTAMAKAAGYQLWIEVTDSNAAVGFIVEDGHARAAPPAPLAQDRQQALSLGV